MQFLAFTYLENSDKTKYGTLITGLQTQQSLKNDQYPEIITEAWNIFCEHRRQMLLERQEWAQVPKAIEARSHVNLEHPKLTENIVAT